MSELLNTIKSLTKTGEKKIQQRKASVFIKVFFKFKHCSFCFYVPASYSAAQATHDVVRLGALTTLAGCTYLWMQENRTLTRP